MTEFTKEDIEYYRKQYALWTSRRQTTPEELHLIGRLRDALDHIEHLYQRIEELEKERRWIPVSERLPKYGRAVLIMTTTSVVPRIGVHSPTIPQWATTDLLYYHDISYSQVTHWMPLPQPPDECHKSL